MTSGRRDECAADRKRMRAQRIVAIERDLRFRSVDEGSRQ
jgi:hypothetical protein